MAPGAMSKNNVLPVWGNDKTMNLNNLILTNIQSSHYFKVNLFELKTYHEVIDEIYYKVSHMEPWEKGSRKTSGQTGMCGGVRGVGAGGIVSTAFCLLYKLFTLKLTRKQVNGLISHCDSPYIRALGFMYIRYTQPPADLWDWYEDYLDDEEELDVKAGTGCMMPIGEMLRHFLTKLEWYSTLFPRIPVPIQKDIEKKLNAHGPLLLPRMLANAGPRPPGPGVAAAGDCENGGNVAEEGSHHSPGNNGQAGGAERHIPDEEVSWGEAERIARLRRSASREKRVKTHNVEGKEDVRGRDRDRGHPRDDCERDRTTSKRSGADRHHDAELNHEKRRHDHRNGGGRDHAEDRHRDKDRKHRSRSRDRERRRSPSPSRDRHHARRRHRGSPTRDRHRDRH